MRTITRQDRPARLIAAFAAAMTLYASVGVAAVTEAQATTVTVAAPAELISTASQ